MEIAVFAPSNDVIPFKWIHSIGGKGGGAVRGGAEGLQRLKEGLDEAARKVELDRLPLIRAFDDGQASAGDRRRSLGRRRQHIFIAVHRRRRIFMPYPERLSWRGMC